MFHYQEQVDERVPMELVQEQAMVKLALVQLVLLRLLNLNNKIIYQSKITLKNRQINQNYSYEQLHNNVRQKPLVQQLVLGLEK
jgi:hypothetical protein